jgi:hypothetical protein
VNAEGHPVRTRGVLDSLRMLLAKKGEAYREANLGAAPLAAGGLSSIAQQENILMTPPKKKSSSPAFTSKSRQLPESAKTQLVAVLIEHDCCGSHQQISRAFREIEKALGFYADGQLHIDNAPRFADIKRAFKPVLNQISTLRSFLDPLDEYSRREFEHHGGDLTGLDKALTNAEETCEQILNSQRGAKRQGAPEHLAEKHVTGMLRGIFWNQLSTAVDDRRTRNCEFKFVKIILLASRILRIKDASKNAARAAENTQRNFDCKLRRLMQDPQAQPRGGEMARKIALEAIVPPRDVPWVFPPRKKPP